MVGLPFVLETLLLNAPRITVVGSYATGLTLKVDRLPSKGESLLGTGYRVDHGGVSGSPSVRKTQSTLPSQSP